MECAYPPSFGILKDLLLYSKCLFSVSGWTENQQESTWASSSWHTGNCWNPPLVWVHSGSQKTELEPRIAGEEKATLGAEG